MSDSLSSIFIPPAISDGGAALRSGFTAAAIQTALSVLEGLAGTGLTFHAGELPDEADGVGIKVLELPEPEEPYLGRRKAVAVCTGRSAATDFSDGFSHFAALFPVAEVDAGSIHFSSIVQRGTCAFAETVHHGIRKRTAKLELICGVDLTQSTFAETSDNTAAATTQQWAALHPSAVEAALASYLGIKAGALPDDETGSAVRVTECAALNDPEWRDFSCELAIRALGHAESEQTLTALLAGIPAENLSPNGVQFNGVWQEGMIRFDAGTLFDRSCVLARAELTARVNTIKSQGAAASSGADDFNRNVTAFDPAALERALAVRIANALGLAIDQELCRGEFPPPGCKVAPVAAVRLTGISSGNRDTGWRVQVQLQLRAPHRDELFRRILAFDALFPRYEETLGGLTVRAILKDRFNLSWQEKNGRNLIVADLALELVL